MFSQNGLSLDQAPPISVVFRFFLSGSIFGILSGFFILFFNNEIFNPASTEAIILTHTLTLGVMLSFMLAALFQMLPVIAGVILSAPIKKANLIQYPFILGILILLLAFYTTVSWLFLLASLLLGGSIFYTITIMLKNLIKLPNHSASSKGMMLALVSLAMVIVFALYMTGTLSGIFSGEYYSLVKEVHYSFGLFGWIALLIIAISFQVIEMFYVTPAYPKFISEYLPIKLLALLLLGFLISFFTSKVWIVINIFLALLLSSYAILTLKRLTQRKRPLTDATVWFWRLGLSSLIVSMALILITSFTNIEALKQLSYIFFISFALSIVFAMFYKIVPFLTWFHLNSQGYFTAPMMHEVIHPKTAKKHLYIHIATIIAFILSIFISPLIYMAGVLTILSFGWISYQIIHAHLLYKKTQETGEKFDMGSMHIK
jgi:MFS family permease